MSEYGSNCFAELCVRMMQVKDNDDDVVPTTTTDAKVSHRALGTCCTEVLRILAG